MRWDYDAVCMTGNPYIGVENFLKVRQILLLEPPQDLSVGPVPRVVRQRDILWHHLQRRGPAAVRFPRATPRHGRVWHLVPDRREGSRGGRGVSAAQLRRLGSGRCDWLTGGGLGRTEENNE